MYIVSRLSHIKYVYLNLKYILYIFKKITRQQKNNNNTILLISISNLLKYGKILRAFHSI
jgi:hypothetical protein